MTGQSKSVTHGAAVKKTHAYALHAHFLRVEI